jgi:hypothetical protein
MEDFIFAPMVLAVGAAIHAAFLRKHSAAEGNLLTLGFVLHVASGFGQVLVTKYYYGYGDMLVYYEHGVPIADALWRDFGSIAPELWKAFLQREDAAMPLPLFGAGSSHSMGAVAAVMLMLLGNSLYAASLACGIASYVSRVLVVRALSPFFRPEQQRMLIIGALLLPSAAFWSSGMLKEPIVMAMLGPMILALQWLATGKRRALAVLTLAACGLMTAMIKPYVLMALSIAAGVFYLWTRFQSRASVALKPFAVITAGAIAMGGLVFGARVFTKADASAAQAFAAQRQVGYQTVGGSNFSLEGPMPEAAAIAERSLLQELALAPLALGTALFRPFLFEARNAVQLVTALESTVLLVMVLQTIRRRRWSGLMQQVRTSPVLMFCLVFVLALALGTGLATTNMGTLSRYRAPMSPFYFILILVTWSEGRSVRRAGAAAQPSHLRRA